mmetsp:Transcript_33920/g.62419  ORF Transcript_33920/g.62419 Transcript_33920/m.62419 type:complete len:106 (+) Transcript_33920:300-617(+)
MTAGNMTLFCRLGALAHEPLPPRELLLAAPRLCCSFPVASLGISFWFYLCSSAETGEIATLLFVHVHCIFAVGAAFHLLPYLAYALVFDVMLHNCFDAITINPRA